MAATGLKPQVIGDLREVHLGEWEGGEYRRRMHERDPVAMKALMEERWDAIPGAEPMDALAARVVRRPGHDARGHRPGRARRRRAARRRDRRAVPSGHAVSRPFAFIHADNCSITRIVEFSVGHRLLRSFNDTAHLVGA